jgi:hypothetical protein
MMRCVGAASGMGGERNGRRAEWAVSGVGGERGSLTCLEPTSEASSVAIASRVRPVASGKSVARIGAMPEGR